MKLSDQRVSMNKAFVRESDHDVRHCPFCGSLGQAVGRVTLDAWLKPPAYTGKPPLLLTSPAEIEKLKAYGITVKDTLVTEADFNARTAERQAALKQEASHDLSPTEKLEAMQWSKTGSAAMVASAVRTQGHGRNA